MSFRTFITQFTPRKRPRARLPTFNRDLTTSCASFSFLRPWFPKSKILICLAIDSTMELPLPTNLYFSGGSTKPPTRISHSPRDWKRRIGKGQEWRDCNMVRSKYLESSQKQLMIDIPGGLKVCLPCCLCTFDGSLLLKSDAHDKEAMLSVQYLK